MDLSDPPTSSAYAADRDDGKLANRVVVDTILSNGTPFDSTDDFDVVVVPSGNALVGIADRAGYPVLTVPAGFGTGGNGRNPIGVNFIGAAFTEDKVLAAGYAYEQASERAGTGGPPSYTNPSMWRCVPYSTFFSPHHCHPGDLAERRGGGGPDGVPGRGERRRHGRADAGAVAELGDDEPRDVRAGHRGGLHVERDGVADEHAAATRRCRCWIRARRRRATSSTARTRWRRRCRCGRRAPAGRSRRSRRSARARSRCSATARPVSNDPVTIGFKQPISATEPLRTGSYSKTLLFTASTLSP